MKLFTLLLLCAVGTLSAPHLRRDCNDKIDLTAADIDDASGSSPGRRNDEPATDYGKMIIHPKPHKRWFFATIAVLAWASNSIPKGNSLALGVLSFSKQVFDLTKCASDFHSWQKQGDCFFIAANLALGTFVALFNSRNLGTQNPGNAAFFVPLAKPEYGIWDLSNHTTGLTHAVAHVPTVNGSLLHGLYTSENNGTWLHAASVYSGSNHTHNIHYRLAHPDDLGHENEGSSHQLRVSKPSLDMSSIEDGGQCSVPDQIREGGLVLDYLWQSNDQYQSWAYFQGGGNTMGSEAANWAETNDSEAFCASPIYMDWRKWIQAAGLMAYGWNDQPYNFYGRAGDWLNTCGSFA